MEKILIWFFSLKYAKLATVLIAINCLVWATKMFRSVLPAIDKRTYAFGIFSAGCFLGYLEAIGLLWITAHAEEVERVTSLALGMIVSAGVWSLISLPFCYLPKLIGVTSRPEADKIIEQQYLYSMVVFVCSLLIAIIAYALATM